MCTLKFEKMTSQQRVAKRHERCEERRQQRDETHILMSRSNEAWKQLCALFVEGDDGRIRRGDAVIVKIVSYWSRHEER